MLSVSSMAASLPTIDTALSDVIARGGGWCFVDLPVLHDKADIERDADVLGGIARHGDDVGEVAGCETAQLVVGLDQFGGHHGGGPDRLHRGHAPVHQCNEFFGVLAVRYSRRVGAAC